MILHFVYIIYNNKNEWLSLQNKQIILNRKIIHKKVSIIKKKTFFFFFRNKLTAKYTHIYTSSPNSNTLFNFLIYIYIYIKEIELFQKENHNNMSWLSLFNGPHDIRGIFFFLEEYIRGSKTTRAGISGSRGQSRARSKWKQNYETL